MFSEVVVGCNSSIKEESDYQPFIMRCTDLVLLRLVPLGDVTGHVYVTVQFSGANQSSV